MKSLFNVNFNKRIILSFDICFSNHKKYGLDYKISLLPSIRFEKSSNDIVKIRNISYKFTGWKKISFEFLVFNLYILIKNKC